MRLRLRRLLLVILGLCAGRVCCVYAESISVHCSDSYYEKTTDLNNSSEGDVTVYLKSGGEPLGDINVELEGLDEDGAKFEGLSDSLGRVEFSKVPPGSYRAAVRQDENAYSGIGIGDIFIEPSSRSDENSRLRPVD